MANITKDERSINKAQRLYDGSVDKYLDMLEQIDKDIPEIVDILRGVAMGDARPKYQITNQQHSALKDQLSLWKANIQNPEKVLANLHGKLKKEHSKEPNNQQSSTKPTIAQFSRHAKS